MRNIGIAIHGGAGTIRKSLMTLQKETQYKKGLEKALLSGWEVLKKNGSSLDAVETAVEILENNPMFNAGKGSVFTNNKTHEMDASIMDGKTLKAGAVSMIQNIKNPVILARKVMEESEFVFLCGKGAEEFAKKMNLEFKNNEYFFDEFRYKQLLKTIEHDKVQLDHSVEEKKFGTVGAVAVDAEGSLAAATSTGGMTNKKYGRIGDSALIGAGTYASNKTCAVSCTGHGEYFIRGVTAYDVSALMEYKLMTLQNAAEFVINKKLSGLGGEGGLIAIDKDCNMSMIFNSEGMYRASISTVNDISIKIYKQ